MLPHPDRLLRIWSDHRATSHLNCCRHGAETWLSSLCETQVGEGEAREERGCVSRSCRSAHSTQYRYQAPRQKMMDRRRYAAATRGGQVKHAPCTLLKFESGEDVQIHARPSLQEHEVIVPPRLWLVSNTECKWAATFQRDLECECWFGWQLGNQVLVEEFLEIDHPVPLWTGGTHSLRSSYPFWLSSIPFSFPSSASTVFFAASHPWAVCFLVGQSAGYVRLFPQRKGPAKQRPKKGRAGIRP